MSYIKRYIETLLEYEAENFPEYMDDEYFYSIYHIHSNNSSVTKSDQNYQVESLLEDSTGLL